MESNVEEWSEFFGADDAKPVVAKYRGRHGGSALFRPVGIEVFMRVVAELTQKMSIPEAIELSSALPRTLSEPPIPRTYAGRENSENHQCQQTGSERSPALHGQFVKEIE